SPPRPRRFRRRLRESPSGAWRKRGSIDEASRRDLSVPPALLPRLDPVQLAQSITNGVVFGAILALCALGLTLVYGILNLSNFAHGDTLTFGAYVLYLVGTTAYLGPRAGAWGLGFAALVAAAALLDAFWWRKMRRSERAVV